MPNFWKYNYNQDAMIVVNFEEQLQPNTFEYTLHKLIEEHIDLSAFYSKGITSSREIQWQCEHNIIFKALSCDTVPHFTGIAAFVADNPDAIESIFEQVLLVCDQQGLLGNELLAIDGCKMPSNAAKEHSGTLAELTEKREKIRKKIKTCLREHQKLDARKPFRQRDKAFGQQKEKYGKRHRNKVKGVKAVIPASEFDVDFKAKTCRCPMGKDMWLHSEKYTEAGKLTLAFEGRLTDCRHCPIKSQCMRNPASADTRNGHGRQVAFTRATKRTASDWMKRRVDSKQGKYIYSHRMSTVEPVFANTGSNKGLNRFSLRGKTKVQGQWQLYCLVHNIEKIKNYGAIA